MALQDRDCLVLDGLSILGDPRPLSAQPVVEDGIHLRWAFGPQRAFPLNGYHLFRRGYGEPGEHCLSRYFANLPVGGSGKPTLDTPFGQFSAGEIVATDDFEPRACSELSLTKGALRFDLPLGVAASRVVAKIGILPSTPSETVDQIDFRTWTKGDVKNPLDSQGFRINAFSAPGVAASLIRVLSDIFGVGLECNPQLDITLPRPAFDGVVSFSKPAGVTVTLTFYREDRSVIGSPSFGGGGGAVDTVTIFAGTARIVIDSSGGGTLLRQIVVKSRETDATIFVSAIHGDKTSTPVAVHGAFGSIATADVTANDITAVTIDSGGRGAALVELCYWPVAIPIGPPDDILRRRPSLPPSGGEPGPWTMVPNFTYPMRLPITHLLYPASTGSESLAANHTQAAQRIRYGAVADALSAQPATPGSGTLTLVPGSALAKGTGTAWDESLVGRILYPASTDTAFAVMAVTAPDRMILSRPYSGGTALTSVAYSFSAEDVFAQLHDQLGALLSEPLGMRAATMPPAIESDPTRKVILTNGSTVVQGQGTAWSHDFEGLLLEVGANRDLYRILSVDPVNQRLTLPAQYAGPNVTTGYRIVSRSPNNRIESEPAFSIPPLDLLELASLSPAYAQILGLYWNDRSAEAKATYDYIVIADHDGRFHGDAQVALRWLNGSPDFTGDGVDGAQSTPSITHVGSGALPAPSALEVFALPAGRLQQSLDRPDLADSEPGLSIVDLATWSSRPSAQQPLLLDVWRLSHGTQTPPASPPASSAYAQPIDRFAPSRRPASSLSPRPQGWPDPASIHYLDSGSDGLDVGWYSYRLSAIDLWGRFSALSPPIPWHAAADNAQLHPYAVHLEDTTPPPPPTDVMAWVLEPANVKDAGRIEDEAYVTWRNLAGPAARGLRLRWRWPWSHALRAPDLEEFRIYRQSTPLNARFHHIVSVVPSAGHPTHSDVTLAAADTKANDAYQGALLQADERGYPIEGSTAGTNLVLRVRNGGPLGGEPPPAGGDATIVLPTGHPLHRDLFDPLQWESWLAAVAEKAPSNATVTYGVDTLEDPDIITFEDANNPRQGQSAQWNQSAVTIGALPAGVLLDDVRPGIDVIALASAAHYAVLEIASTGPGVNILVPVMPVPPSLASGTYRWSIGPAERLLWGNGGKWTSAGRALDLPRQPNMSRIRPGLDRVYLRVGAASTPETLDHFFDVDSVDAGNHRLILRGNLALLNDGTLYEWRVGTPSRVYEMFLPSDASEADDPQLDGWLKASLADPVVYATLGVSAADKRIEHADVRPGRTPPRHGNEGRLGGPATIFAVQRAQPDIPAEVTWGSAKLLATKAGYDGKSQFTVRWSKPDAVKLPHYRGIVFRALDQTLFLVDWQHQRTLNLQSLTTSPFPATWPAARMALVTAELEGPAYAANLAAATFADAALFYSTLSDDAMTVLANVPGNEDAFAQITIDPLPLIDPAQNDRLGPDDDKATFLGPNAALNAWLDAFDGRSQNRYLYKVAFIDSAQNRGPLCKSTPPVYLPKVAPPRKPVITKVLGGDRQITITWAANREPDLAEYRVYRAESNETSRDVRLMTRMETIVVSAAERQSPPIVVTWNDSAVVGGRVYGYRLSAANDLGLESPPTKAFVAAPFDLGPPPSPQWSEARWVLLRQNGTEEAWPLDNAPPSDAQPVVRLVWTSAATGSSFRIARRIQGRPAWQPVPAGQQELTSTTYFMYDADASPMRAYSYRVVATSSAGVVGEAILIQISAILAGGGQ